MTTPEQRILDLLDTYGAGYFTGDVAAKDTDGFITFDSRDDVDELPKTPQRQGPTLHPPRTGRAVPTQFGRSRDTR